MEALTETLGERSSSFSRAITRFERMAVRKAARGEAAALLELSGSRVEDVAQRVARAPRWLKERIDRSYDARRLMGEDVSEAENARDQVVAFATWYSSHTGTSPAWTMPAPHADTQGAIDRLDSLLATLPLRSARQGVDQP